MSSGVAPLKPHCVNGLPVPSFVLQEDVDKLKELELYPDDVWVVTYPKCGTMWTSQIVKLIRSKGHQDDQILDYAVPWPEAMKMYEIRGYRDKIKVEDQPRPRAFYSHFPYSLLPCGSPDTTPCKYIYVTRNPKDVAVSLYFFMKLGFTHNLEWDTFWKNFIEGDVVFGNYFDHLLSWWPHKDDKNVLLLKYEDMKKDLPQAVSQMASFMNIELSSETVAKIADLTSFEKMKKDNTANLSWVKQYSEDGKPSFLRKGVVGDWKNVLSEEQSTQIDQICAQKFRGLDIEFDFGL